jgi:hypothetical protein
LINVVLAENTGVNGGGAFCYLSSPTFIDCTFWNNSAEGFGGGLRAGRLASPTLINCTLVHNYAGAAGGGVLGEDGCDMTIENSIIAFNDGEAVYCLPGADAHLTCCDVYGNTDGDWISCLEDDQGVNGNIGVDPLFCDADMGNLRLVEDSPCAPFSQPNPECDLIGAWPVGCDPSGVEEGPFPVSMDLAPCIPNPFGTSTRISYAIPENASGQSVRLIVYDAAGRKVRRLVDRPQSGGVHTTRWDGRTQSGEVAANGLYFYRLEWSGQTAAGQVILLK